MIDRVIKANKVIKINADCTLNVQSAFCIVNFKIG